MMTHTTKRMIRLLMAALSLLAFSAACTPAGPTRTTTVSSVDVEQYLGTWYEIASVKQFFSAGLVNTKAEYSLYPNGSIKVVNSGDYFFDGGPLSVITGTAVPVDDSNARLNVSFTGSNSTQPPGNYWIVDLDPDYQWSIVSDATGRSGFILSRTPQISDELRAELLDRAADAGVIVANMTETIQS